MSFNTSNISDNDEILEMANSLRTSRQYEEAIKLYDTYLQTNTQNADAFSFKGCFSCFNLNADLSDFFST